MKTVREIYIKYGSEVNDVPAYIVFDGDSGSMRALNKDTDMECKCYFATCSKDLFDDKKVLTFYCSDML